MLAGESLNPLDPDHPTRWYLVATGEQRMLVREHTRCRFSHGAKGRQYEVSFQVGDDGIRVTELSVLAGPGDTLTARSFQGIGEVIRFAFEEVAVGVSDDGTVATGFLGVGSAELEAVKVRRPRGRPPAVPDDEYRRTADAYRAAQAEGRPTGKAVADELLCSVGTARQRIMGARDRGYLPPADSTRPKL